MEVAKFSKDIRTFQIISHGTNSDFTHNPALCILLIRQGSKRNERTCPCERKQVPQDSPEGMGEASEPALATTREEPRLPAHSRTASQRAYGVSQLIASEGRYGLLSHMSRPPDVSRQTF